MNIVLNVPIIHADFLSGGNGLHINPDPAAVDSNLAGRDQLVATRDIGELGGVNLSGIGGNSNLAFAGLNIVLDIPVVDTDFLSGGHLVLHPVGVVSYTAAQ